jgi:hypothetical protein
MGSISARMMQLVYSNSCTIPYTRKAAQFHSASAHNRHGGLAWGTTSSPWQPSPHAYSVVLLLTWKTLEQCARRSLMEVRTTGLRSSILRTGL